eukprot:s1376_g8.t1
MSSWQSGRRFFLSWIDVDQHECHSDRGNAVLTVFTSMSQGAAQGQDIGQGNVQQDLASCFGAAAKPELVAPVLHESGTSECQASRTCKIIQTVRVVKTITMLCIVGKCIAIPKHRS